MSSTIIDALVVTLGLDPTNFSKNSNLTKKQLTELKKEAEETSANMQRLSTSFIKFFAVLVGVKDLKELVTTVTNTNTALDRLSHNLGVSANDIGAWGNATALNGGSAEAFQGTLQSLSLQLTELATTGQAAILPYLRAFHVDLGKARDSGDELTGILDQLNGAAQGHDRATMHNIFKQMGFDEGTINLLLSTRKEFQETIAAQRALQPTPQQLAASQELFRSYQKFHLEMSSVGRDLVAMITPALTAFFAAVVNGLKWLGQHQKIAYGLAGILLSALVPALLAVAASVWAMLSPFLLLGAILVGVTAAVALLADDWEAWAKHGTSLLGDVLWQPFANLIKRIKGSGSLIYDAIKSGFASARQAIEDALFGGHKVVAEVAGAAQGAAAAVQATRSNPTITPHAVIAAAIHGAIRGAHKAAANADTGGALGFFEGQGWTHEQAAGIVANLRTESGLNPGAVGDGGAAYGIAQWHPDRQRAFEKWSGKSIRDASLMDQLRFVQYELTQGTERGAGKRLATETTAQGAGAAFSRFYERPADVAGEQMRRGATAAQLASQYAAQPGASTTNKSSTTTVQIGTLAVHTQATDAAGIAKALPDAIRDRMLANNADYGPN